MIWVIENFKFIKQKSREKFEENNLYQSLAINACAHTYECTHTYAHANMYTCIQQNILTLAYLYIKYFVQ